MARSFFFGTNAQNVRFNNVTTFKLKRGGREREVSRSDQTNTLVKLGAGPFTNKAQAEPSLCRHDQRESRGLSDEISGPSNPSRNSLEPKQDFIRI